ncbi:MAG TPA: CatB-related O-acetyltransferase [Lachnospiraceae bacterium]|nr:CatB-related O-acetyltransferase [Lachnospiraceae bacterium]
MLKRKLEEAGSGLYRSLIYPFVRIGIEKRTHSIMKQKSYLNKGSVLNGKNYIGKRVVLSHTTVGFGSYINDDGNFSNTVIGKYTSVGTDVSVLLGRHPVGKFAAMHPAFYSTGAALGYSYAARDSFEEFDYVDKERGIQIVIGNDVWIGSGVRIMEGVTIGDGAVIGAGALVLTDVEPYAVVAGVPAKKIRMRFSGEQIEKLLTLQWWNKGEAWIREHAEAFCSVEELLRD